MSLNWPKKCYFLVQNCFLYWRNYHFTLLGSEIMYAYCYTCMWIIDMKVTINICWFHQVFWFWLNKQVKKKIYFVDGQYERYQIIVKHVKLKYVDKYFLTFENLVDIWQRLLINLLWPIQDFSYTFHCSRRKLYYQPYINTETIMLAL